MTPRCGTVRVKSMGWCQFSDFRFNSRGNTLGGEGNCPAGQCLAEYVRVRNIQGGMSHTRRMIIVGDVLYCLSCHLCHLFCCDVSYDVAMFRLSATTAMYRTRSSAVACREDARCFVWLAKSLKITQGHWKWHLCIGCKSLLIFHL